MIYPNNPLYLLSLLGYIYYLTYYTLTTKNNIFFIFFLSRDYPEVTPHRYFPCSKYVPNDPDNAISSLLSVHFPLP